jgi:hydrogenase maturation protease
MKHLIFGAGNLIFSDEGFGVHFIRYMQERYEFPANVELYDGGTLGIMVSHMLEDADHVLLIDVIESKGEPGDIFRFEKEDFMLNRIPVKMSPHQIGIQEVLTLSELRDRCPDKVTLYGLIPESYATSAELTPTLAARLPVVAEMVLADLAAEGVSVNKRLM